jgi:histidinol-phosphate aminotransferase
MTDWAPLLRPQLTDLGPYAPGPSVDELKREYGLDELAKLNWNEGLFGPLPGVLDAVAAELDESWAYPEHAYLELREGIAAETGARAEQILPAHGIQTLILTLCSAFLSPGDSVVVPQPTYGLYAQASRAAGAVVERVHSPELALDLERIADAAHRSQARIAWICDPNNPTGSLIDAAQWAAFWTRCRPAASPPPTRPTSTTWSPPRACGARTTWPRGARLSCCGPSRRYSGSRA